MRHLIGRLKCFFGFHDWFYETPPSSCPIQFSLQMPKRQSPISVVRCNRTCQRPGCGKEQHSMYDMCYGGTFWLDGKYW